MFKVSCVLILMNNVVGTTISVVDLGGERVTNDNGAWLNRIDNLQENLELGVIETLQTFSAPFT